MKPMRFLPVVLGMVLLGVGCVPPRNAPRPPKPPKPPRPPHGVMMYQHSDVA